MKAEFFDVTSKKVVVKEVLRIEDHIAVDCATVDKGAIVRFVDGSFEFIWNCRILDSNCVRTP